MNMLEFTVTKKKIQSLKALSSWLYMHWPLSHFSGPNPFVQIQERKKEKKITDALILVMGMQVKTDGQGQVL